MLTQHVAFCCIERGYPQPTTWLSGPVNFFIPRNETVCPADWLRQSKVQLFRSSEQSGLAVHGDFLSDKKLGLEAKSGGYPSALQNSVGSPGGSGRLSSVEVLAIIIFCLLGDLCPSMTPWVATLFAVFAY
jgi:hypothetical protein